MKEIVLNVKEVNDIIADANMMCANDNSSGKTLEHAKAEKAFETMFGGWREAD